MEHTSSSGKKLQKRVTTFSCQAVGMESTLCELVPKSRQVNYGPSYRTLIALLVCRYVNHEIEVVT